MRFDPRRALVGLAMAGTLVIAPPAIGYAMSGVGSHGHDAAIQSVMADNDNADADDNVNDDNINADNINDDNDNVSAASPGADGAYVPPPTPGPSLPATDDGGNNNPNNSDSPGNGGNGGATARRWIPPMDLVETQDDFVLKADLPGIGEDDVGIELENNVLTISGERKAEHEERHEGYYRVERSFGQFRRSLTLPDGVDPEGIAARFDKGVEVSPDALRAAGPSSPARSGPRSSGTTSSSTTPRRR